MSRGLRLNQLPKQSLLLIVVLSVFVPAKAGAIMVGPKQHGPLSPALAKLAQPSIRSQSPEQQAEALGLPSTGPGSLVREGAGILVEVRFGAGALEGLDELRAAGAEVLAFSRRFQSVTAAIRPGALPAVAGVSGVGSVSAVPAPIVFASEECEGGSVISEGVAQINAKAARDKFSLDGAGVTVGVLSDSYDKSGGAATSAGEDVETADLPGILNPCLKQKIPVDVRQEFEPGEPGEEGTDEGRAMLQIVHDVAPAAKLAFASAFLGELAFADSIEELAEPVFFGGAGAKVIVDDIAYFGEPFFQDGPVGAAVNKVTAEGATYLSAAGNNNLIDSAGRDVASWEAPGFRDAGSCPAVVQGLKGFNGTHCMDFNPDAATDTTFGITVEPGDELILDLQWAEPWFGVGTDLDAFLLNSGGTQILKAAYSENEATERPAELFFWANESSSPRAVQLVLNRFSGGNPRLKFVLMENGGGVSGTEYPFSHGGDLVGPTVFGHSGSAGAISIGAVPFNNSAKPERYSSRGPVTHYFEKVNGTSPAAPLGSPQVIPKPDVVATDCAATTFFAFLSGGKWRFCGTSAAAPHAAGAVALMMQAAEAEGGGLDQPGPIRAALLGSASPVGSFGPCAVGAGLVETVGAVEELIAGPEPLTALDCGLSPVPATDEPSPAPSLTPPAAPTPPSVPAPDRAPNTTILKHPAKVVRVRAGRARLVFRFGADQRQVTFLCMIDRGAFRPCPARLVLRLRPGRHLVRVKARGAGGAVDPTPAVFRFRVERS
jgi:hypothetical protein